MIWRLEYENAHGDVARLDIQRGAATPVEIIEGTENPFLLSYELEDKSKKGFVMSSFADISIYETATFNIDDLKTLDETALSVKWYINSVLEWTGFVVPDFFSRTIGEPAIVNLAASDRLSSLEDATLDGLGEYVKLEDLAIACLAKTGLSLPLISTVDFKTGTTNVMDALALSERLEDNKGKKISCFDVLRSILVLTNSTIRQRKGQWRIYNKIQHEAVAPTLTFDEVYQGAKRTIQPVFSSVGAFQEFGGIKIYPKNNTFSNSAAGWVAENGFVTEFDNRELNYTSPDLPPTFGEETNKINLINRNIWIPGSFDTAKKLSSPPFKVPFRGTDRVAFTLEINASAAPNQRFRYALIKRVNGVPVSFMRNDDTWLQGPGSGSYSGSWSFFPRQKDGEPYSSVDAIFTINANVSLEESEDPEKVTLTVHILGVDSYAPAGVQTLVSAIRSMTVKFDEKNDAKGILYRTDQLGNFSKKSDPNTTIFGDHISRGLNGYFYPYAEDDTSILRSPSGLNLPLYKWTTATDPTAGELPILQHVTRQMSRMFGVAHNVLSAVIDAKTFDPLAIVANCAGEKYVIVAATFDFLRSTVEVELQQIAYGSLLRRDFIFSYFGGGDGDGISSIGSVSGGGSSGGSGGGIPQTLDLLVDELFISGGNSVDLGVYARKTWVETEATAFNSARLGGQLASAYTRRDVNEVVTGWWNFQGNEPRLYMEDNTQQKKFGFANSGGAFIVSRYAFGTNTWQATLLNINIDAPTNSFIITSNGNVGFGIAPTERLHVAGNGLFSGAVTAGGNVGTSNFASQALGWRVTPTGVADFRHIYTDELQAKAFTADISQALVGSDVLTKSVAKLAQNWATTANGATSTIYVEELEGFPGFQVFAVGDRLLLRLFDRSGGGLLIKNIWATVTSYVSTTNNVQRYTITVNSGGATGRTVYAGSMILDYGTSGSGVIERTVLDQQGSPYSRVSTWTGSPDNPANYTLHYQSGNLNGISNASGWGVYSENTFLTGKLLVGDLTKAGQFMEYKNGQLNIKGKITVTGGNAATKQDIDDLEIGGRNLVEKTNQGITNIQIDSSAGATTWTTSEEIVDGVRCAKGTKNTTAVETWALFNLMIYTPSKFRANKQYAISFKMKPSFAVGNQTIRFSTTTNQGLSTNSDNYSLVAGEWNHVKLVVTTLPDFDTILAGRPTVHLRLFIVGNSSTGDTVLLKDIKIEEGNKASAYAQAPEDVTAEITAAKQEALTAAGNAQSTANSANTAVGNLSGYVDGAFKDGVIDTAEAKAIEKYKNSLAETKLSVDGAYTQLYNSAYLEGSAKSNLSSAKGALNSAYTSLVTSIDNAIADGKTTAAEKTDVDSKFGLFNTAMATYQVRAEEANSAINVKLDTISKGYVDAIEVGGRNLILNSSFAREYDNWGTPGGSGHTIATGASDSPSMSSVKRSAKWTNTAEAGQGIVASTSSSWPLLENGKEYVITCWVKASSASTLSLQGYGDSGNVVDSFKAFSVNTNWQKIVHIITGDGQSNPRVRFFGRNNGVTYWVNCPKVELGNRATDWTPAPEDVPSALDYLAKALQDGETDIAGGLVSTSVLMVKDTNGTVRGGMSGLSNDNVGFWTGGNYQAAINNYANVIFRKDGSFSLAGNKISGTSGGVLSIDGGVITGNIESSNYNSSTGSGSQFDLTNGNLKIGGAINIDSFNSEIQVKNRETGNNIVKIGDFPLSSFNLDSYDFNKEINNQKAFLASSSAYTINGIGYLDSIGRSDVLIRSSTTSTQYYLVNNLTVGNSYRFFIKGIKLQLVQNTVLSTLEYPFPYLGFSGGYVKVQVKNGSNVIKEEEYSTNSNGITEIDFISLDFMATSTQLQLVITPIGDFYYHSQGPNNTTIQSNCRLIIERVISFNAVKLQSLTNAIELSTRGFQIVFSGNNYFKFDSAICNIRGTQYYESKNGLYGLRIENDGVYIRRNGKTWIAL